jgi:hypothetical protein
MRARTAALMCLLVVDGGADNACVACHWPAANTCGLLLVVRHTMLFSALRKTVCMC